MRDIVFRGKAVDSGEWKYGDLTFYAGGAQIWETTDDGKWNLIVDPSTVGQFTGLTDKNGVRIFEGDIVGYVPYWNTSAFEKGVVKFGNYRNYFNDTEGALGFYVEWLNNDMELKQKSLPYWVKSVEVCGNVHDNPEMMGGGGAP